MKIYTLQYKLHGNKWIVRVIASTLKEAKRSASEAMFCPPSWFSKVKVENTFRNTFGAERAA